MNRKQQRAASVNTEQKQSGLVPFEAGKSGNPNGRPKGSRNKLGEEFIAAVYEDFRQHGAAAIATVRQEKPAEYLRVVASLVPKVLQFEGDGRSLDALTDAELMALIYDQADACGLAIAEADDDAPPASRRDN